MTTTGVPHRHRQVPTKPSRMSALATVRRRLAEVPTAQVNTASASASSSKLNPYILRQVKAAARGPTSAASAVPDGAGPQAHGFRTQPGAGPHRAIVPPSHRAEAVGWPGAALARWLGGRLMGDVTRVQGMSLDDRAAGGTRSTRKYRMSWTARSSKRRPHHEPSHSHRQPTRGALG